MKSAFVLPTASAAGHLTTDVLADALMRLTKQPNGRIQLAGGQVRPHDARRTFVAAATQAGVQELISERVLHHSRGAVADTNFGAGSEFERRREAHERVDEYWTAVREGRKANVVPPGAARTVTSGPMAMRQLVLHRLYLMAKVLPLFVWAQ
jgi:hypothetical protein